MTPAARIISASSTRDFQDAVILGMGLPTEILGKPCKYAWKEVLPLGEYLDAKKEKFKVDSARVDRLINNFNRAKSKAGFTPFLPPNHKERSGAANYGFAVDTRKNERGSLEVLCQLVGEDAALAAARNKVSICTVCDVTDEHGNQYDELIDHVAIIPDPQLNGLESFTPAIAASRGSVPVSSFTLAAQNEKDEPMLDLKKLRATLKAADDLADEKVIELALSRIAESEPIAAQVVTLKADLTKARADADAATAKLQTSESKVLELSRRPEPIAPPTPREMLVLSRSLKSDRQAAIEAGGVSPDCAKELDKLFETEGRPNGLALSSVGSGADDLLAFRVWSILKTNKPTPIGEKTGMQFSRQTPVDDPDQKSEKELAAAGRAQGKAYAEAGAK